MAEASSLAERTLDQVRELAFDLRPRMLDDLGLVPTMRWYVNRLAGRANMEVDFRVSGVRKRLSPKAETALYRVAQEALTNVARHAQARKVRLRLVYRARTTAILIEDDGRGFDVEKLEALDSRSVPLTPAGRFVGPVVIALLFAGAPALVLLWAGALYFRAEWGPRPAVPLILTILGALLGLLTIRLILNAKADTPKRAVRLFFYALARGNAKRARRLVVPNDLDGFPRYHPDIPGHPRLYIDPFRFDAPEGFHAYWRGLLRYHTMPYCIASVRAVKVQEISPDVVVVDFRARFIMNTQLWWLLILVALIIALIVDLATRKTVVQQMRKILVRVDDEWHLFNGEWMGREERDAGWI